MEKAAQELALAMALSFHRAQYAGNGSTHAEFAHLCEPYQEAPNAHEFFAQAHKSAQKRGMPQRVCIYLQSAHAEAETAHTERVESAACELLQTLCQLTISTGGLGATANGTCAELRCHLESAETPAEVLLTALPIAQAAQLPPLLVSVLRAAAQAAQEQCPGCGSKPGEGVNPACTHPDGCNAHAN